MGVAAGVVAGQPIKMCVDEMVNLTFSPFARTIQRIRKKCVSIFLNLCFVGREVVFSDDVLRDILYLPAES